jgi:SAM-dependent methyltransferase
MVAFTASRKKLQLETSIGHVHHRCPICDCPELDYEFIVDNYPVCACRYCNLMFLNPQPEKHPEPESKEFSDVGIYDIRSANSAAHLDHIAMYSGAEPGRLLLIGGDNVLEEESRRRGFNVTRLSAAEFEDITALHQSEGEFDACILLSSLQAIKDPLAALQIIRRLLTADGTLMAVCPALDSRTARMFRSSWWEFSRRNRYYFSRDTLQCLLLKAGFGDPLIMPDESIVSLQYMRKKLATLPPKFRYRLLSMLLALSPGFLRHRAFRFLHSRVAVIVRPKERAAKPGLSVIVPVYNERATFVPLMQALVAKEINGVDIEIILVESNSTDGTREQVLGYQGHPRVTVILEERPQGKGHAVRNGLKAATGDILLIQDADLEYDIGDYDGLLEPILNYQQNFVIGSRHLSRGRVWKIRKFNDAGGLAVLLNFGHMTFLGLFNLLYQQRLNDPFSMFKVFRRECLYGLSFECNRFDFDYEITIKLLRKGYKPLEVPVNYRSRSFKEGKKISMIRDPLTWLRALVKYRTSPLYSDARPSAAPQARMS